MQRPEFFSGYFSSSTEKYVVWPIDVKPSQPQQLILSMVVVRASIKFLVGVSFRFGRQVRINSKLSIN